MIILPDRNIARGKFLMPMQKREWYRPHPFGPDVNLHFMTWVAQAWRHDPHFHWYHKHRIIWQGHFEDREDADEFMWAVYSGTIKSDPYLKRLPIYCPDFDPDMLRDPSIHYNMVSNIGIGPSSGNWGSPGDCYGLANRAGEFVDCIAAGGSGSAATPGNLISGGGGGGFARRTDLAWGPGQQMAFDVGNGGAAPTASGNRVHGVGGTAHTYFYSPANPGVRATVGGGGSGAGSAGGPVGGGPGGGADAGNYGMGGGRGGNLAGGSYGSCCTGGGAAANPSGGGATGGDINSVVPAGTVTGGGGGAGLIYGPWGPGAGGTGAKGQSGTSGGAGSHYGGGGGAGMGSSIAHVEYGGAGGAGLIVIRYEPQYAPTINWISPNSGPTAGGQAVRINGSFVEVTSANIGGAPLTGMSWNSTDVYGTTSAGGAGTYNVNVYRSNGPSPGVGGSLYSYVPPPSVSSCAPSSGPTTPGNAVLAVITGANMNGVSSVTFGGVAASPIAVINSTTVHAWVPAHAAGLVNVAVANGYGSGNANVFTYVTPPSLSAVASPVPALGLTHGGTAVTLTGANLSGVTSVTFGGAAATSVVVVNANTITCITPAHARGLVDIVATNIYGSGTLSNAFTYLLPAAGFNMPMMGV